MLININPKKQWMAWLLSVLGLLAILSWTTTELSRLDDRSAFNHVDGAWSAMAFWALEGKLYPPLFDGEHVTGTRYAPIPILLHAGWANITDSYLAAARLSNITGSIILVSILAFFAYRRSLRPSICFALIGLFLIATQSKSNVMLPVALQALAVILIMVKHPPSQLRLIMSAICCTLAVCAKLSAVWAPIALLIWLAIYYRKECVLLFIYGVGFGLTAFLTIQLASEGRFLNTMQVCLLGEPSTHSFIDMLYRGGKKVVNRVVSTTPLVSGIVPLVLYSLWTNRRYHDTQLIAICLACCFILTAYMFKDAGVESPHLADLSFLIFFALVDLISKTNWHQIVVCRNKRDDSSIDHSDRPALAQLTAITLTWLLASTIVSSQLSSGIKYHSRQLLQDPLIESSRDRKEWLDKLDSPSKILSCDASVPLALGQSPTISDPFMLRLIGQKKPDVETFMIQEIQSHRFTHILMLTETDGSLGLIPLKDIHWGKKILDTIEQNYKLDRYAGEYVVYIPRK